MAEPLLLSYLREKDNLLYGKALEIRGLVASWLEYVPTSFPHYTRHTIAHSDELVAQASKLIFDGDSLETMKLPLSAVEAFVLVVASYLHDAGMVASDEEKREILASEEWSSWLEGSPARQKQIEEIEFLRKGGATSPSNFVADVLTRRLLADFIRPNHHLRVRGVLPEFKVVLFNDERLLRAIEAVCVGHGLSSAELTDADRYPFQSDIRGDHVNVRLLAVLLRLSDLLDLSSDRACPMVMSAASPLPRDSIAHWTQFNCITHQTTSPARIEITAECGTQEEHRVLQDWCKWIVDESLHAGTVLAGYNRHGGWRAPLATMDGGDAATIKIRPSSSATYRPSSWTFQLDPELVFSRLINDTYDSDLAFIRELIQNALDASRCQVVVELSSSNQDVPRRFADIGPEALAKHPVRLSIGSRTVLNELVGDEAELQTITVEDFGVGMDRSVVERFFLQVGRSFYATEEFRRSFRFSPSSRFGLGFLSVFAVSDHVEVETFKPSASTEALKLTLTGPRNYLLLEKSARTMPGTKITVTLRESIDPKELLRFVERLCPRVEFPILFSTDNGETELKPENPEDFLSSAPDVTDSNHVISIRSWPIDLPDADGELYVRCYTGEDGERWDLGSWLQYTYLNRHPAAYVPPIPGDLVCLNGIDTHAVPFGSWFTQHNREGTVSMRLNVYNQALLSFSMSRHNSRFRRQRFATGPQTPEVPGLNERLIEVLNEHLSGKYAMEHGWKYKQRLVRLLPLRTFWDDRPDTLLIYKNGKEETASLSNVLASENILTVGQLGEANLAFVVGESEESPYPAFAWQDLGALSDQHYQAIFDNYHPHNVKISEGGIVVDWMSGPGTSVEGISGSGFYFAPCEGTSKACVRIHPARSPGSIIVLNTEHPLIAWLIRLEAARNESDFPKSQFRRLCQLLKSAAEYPVLDKGAFRRYLDLWSQMDGLREDWKFTESIGDESELFSQENHFHYGDRRLPGPMPRVNPHI